jgi:AmmeMemoRadiSam system protein B/AmmeMemoRadiSam system protein A
MKLLRMNIILLFVIFCFAAACQANKTSDSDVRDPAVAGKFYPESATKLRLSIEKFLQDAVSVNVKKPLAIIVPHAGYLYSGQICADGFKQVRHQKYDVIVILGTNHTSPNLQGISLYPGEGYRTPLGTATVDKSIISSLLKESPNDCILDKSAHESEHSLEVVVPFIQVVFPKAKIVPIVVGSQDLHICTRFGQALATVLKNKNALIVASSDFSHYPSRDDANRVDRKTLEAIAKLNTAEFHKTIQDTMNKNIPNLSTCACGAAPIMAAMSAAKSLGASRGVIVSYANSGDVPIGERSRVVGYGAVVLTADGDHKEVVLPEKKKTADVSSSLTASDKKKLLAFARETLTRIFVTDTVPLARNFSTNLQQPRGAFVTLKKKSELRGCVGHMIPDEPLVKIVGTMAIQAAFNDSRFHPVTFDELKDIDIEISVLTPMKKVAGSSDILVGRDGVYMSKDGHFAVFLPQVAPEQGWNREQMLDHLCQKAGLDSGCWKKGAQFSTFQAVIFSESELK